MLYSIIFNLHQPFILAFQVSTNASRNENTFKGFNQAGATHGLQSPSVVSALSRASSTVHLHFSTISRAHGANLSLAVIQQACLKRWQFFWFLFFSKTRDPYTDSYRMKLKLLKQLLSTQVSYSLMEMLGPASRMMWNCLAVVNHCQIPNSIQT